MPECSPATGIQYQVRYGTWSARLLSCSEGVQRQRLRRGVSVRKGKVCGVENVNHTFITTLHFHTFHTLPHRHQPRQSDAEPGLPDLQWHGGRPPNWQEAVHNLLHTRCVRQGDGSCRQCASQFLRWGMGCSFTCEHFTSLNKASGWRYFPLLHKPWAAPRGCIRPLLKEGSMFWYRPEGGSRRINLMMAFINFICGTKPQGEGVVCALVTLVG